MLEATMDVYTFMKSSMTGVPLLSLQGALDFNPGADPLQNEALVQMWMEVKIKPLLRSVTKHFLSCLSTKNFSCSTYQTVYVSVVNGFMMAFRPVGSFVHDFVSFTQERNVSEIRSATLTQFLLNWTLAELADVYQPQNTSIIPEEPKFDVTNVEDWYQQVVMPVLRRFFPNVEDLLHENITLAFHELTDAVENVAHVLHCAARSNLTMSEETIMRLLEELTVLLNSLMKELSTANFKEVASNFQEIFGEPDSPSLTQSHLEDPNFIKLWFKLKLMPLLPDIPNELLSCLSTKNFSCPVFQTIIEALSKHMDVLYSDPKYSHNIYKHFIFPFLLHHNTS
eukprot:superscaffoldBa00006491_g21590